MTKYNKKKSELLGLQFGTACNKLRRLIMFQLVQETGRDVCFQCGELIESVDELSIEHKQPWSVSENPREAFFDLSNIAFSHNRCNIPSNRGRDNGRAKLTPSDVRLIRSSSKTNSELAREYGVSRTTLRYARTGQTWKHI